MNYSDPLDIVYRNGLVLCNNPVHLDICLENTAAHKTCGQIMFALFAVLRATVGVTLDLVIISMCSSIPFIRFCRGFQCIISVD